MKSKSEKSYGARIGNAGKLATALQSFADYQPQKPEFGFAAFQTQITQTKSQNNTVASKKQIYSLAVESRKQLFEKNTYSIKKILSPINATVKASYGKEAKEAIDVASIIAKIRGANTKYASTADHKTVSQSYQSFSSKTQFFADLLTNLTYFGTNYNPSNNELTLTNLGILHSNASTANNTVMDSFSQFIQQNDTRMSSYNTLAQTALRIKDNVKSQYGLNSTEYSLIKKLSI
ncbi:MAG: hypothetical protein ABI426_10975 [Flavobacterium sp.]